VNESEKKNRRKPFEDIGRNLDEDLERLIAYINDELVPSVRKHSTRGMRIAAEKLSQFADYMERKQAAEPCSQDTESDKNTPES
jgi:hypothetical protein